MNFPNWSDLRLMASEFIRHHQVEPIHPSQRLPVSLKKNLLKSGDKGLEKKKPIESPTTHQEEEQEFILYAKTTSPTNPSHPIITTIKCGSQFSHTWIA